MIFHSMFGDVLTPDDFEHLAQLVRVGAFTNFTYLCCRFFLYRWHDDGDPG